MPGQVACDPGLEGVAKGELRATYRQWSLQEGMGGSRAVVGGEGKRQFKKNGPDTVLPGKGEKPLLEQA